MLPYIPAPRVDLSQGTSPCLLQVSPGRLYTSNLRYLYFVIRRGHDREAHQASFGVSPPTSACVHSVTSSACEWDQRGPNSPPSKSESLEQSRALGSSSLQAQLWAWASVTCGRVLRGGRNQNSKLVTWILTHEHAREMEMLPCWALCWLGMESHALSFPSCPTPGRNNFPAAKMWIFVLENTIFVTPEKRTECVTQLECLKRNWKYLSWFFSDLVACWFYDVNKRLFYSF